ncbi:MAG: lamin tail domain-containing protein [Phycisphaeraceae bacterium]|nr:lamin tail domain-containing protein [Phycisphaeraceae bacterium]
MIDRWFCGVVCVVCLSGSTGMAQDVVISEFMAANDKVQDDQGDTSDWIELHNTSNQAVDLSGWYLTDSLSDLMMWAVPDGMSLAGNAYLAVYASGKDRSDPTRPLHTSFQLSRSPGTVALVGPDGVTIESYYEYPVQFKNVSYGVSSLGGSVSETVLLAGGVPARAMIPAEGSLGLDWVELDFDDSDWLIGRTGIGYDYGNLIGLDTGAMRYTNATVYCRMAFDVQDATDLASLTLRMKYEDGFVAYLNGIEVARDNAPTGNALTWNASARATREDSDAQAYVDFLLSPESLDALVLGRNMLAVHGLNTNANSSDLLVLPELVGVVVSNAPPAPEKGGYLMTPSPGASNDRIQVSAGPGVFDVTAVIAVLQANEDLVVTARVTALSDPVAAVTLNVRVGYGPEMPWPMQDDGLEGDAVAGDAIYSTVVPEGLYRAGDMVRWAVTATDTQNNKTREPPVLVALQYDEYYGTVVADPAKVSTLPVIQWFVQNVGGSQGDSGTRGSVYYLGEFYDNITVHRRGGSTAGAIKTHFKLNFNEGRKFRFDPNEARVNEINLNSPYSDKAYLRQALAFEAYDWCGSPGSKAFPVVGYRNNEFFGVQIMIEEPEEEMLTREGLDPDGALYKMYNTFNNGGSAEKKTRRWEGRQDLNAFTQAINNASGTTLHNNIMDLVNLPLTLNYLAATILTHQNDHPHKNHYLYCDSEGSGQWFFMPWDHDLTWGSNWTGNSYHDTIYAAQDQVPGKPSAVKPSHPFVGKQDCQEWNYHWNHLIDALLNDTMVREMYLRRLRTVMDDFLKAPGTSPEFLFIENRIDQLAVAMDVEVQKDYNKWANPWSWGGQGGYNRNQSFDAALDILKTDYLAVRRHHLFVTHLAGNAAQYPIPGSYSAQIPEAQSIDCVIEFGRVESDPDSHNQDQEYIELVNPQAYAVDLSGWRLTGAVSHKFLPGTVIVGHGQLIVSPNIRAFRNRTTSPMWGEGHFVQGNYKGHLSNWGETVRLLDRDGVEVSRMTYQGMPSSQQQSLRISEIMYHPADPGTGVNPEDLEFIEVLNISDSAVSLEGVRFTAGIGFELPDMTLASHGVLVIAKSPGLLSQVADLAGATVLGPYEGRLSNNSERVKLEDRHSNTIQEFTYQDIWVLATDGGGYSLEMIDPVSTPPQDYDEQSHWQASALVGGSPGQTY